MKKTATVLLTMGITLLSTTTIFAGEWKNESGNWRWKRTDGTYFKDTWRWLDGNNDNIAECYYFGSDGAVLINTTTPDGFTVNENGAWVVDGKIQTKETCHTVSSDVSIEEGMAYGNLAGKKISYSDPSAYIGTYVYKKTSFLPDIANQDYGTGEHKNDQIVIKSDGEGGISADLSINGWDSKTERLNEDPSDPNFHVGNWFHYYDAATERFVYMCFTNDDFLVFDTPGNSGGDYMYFTKVQ